MPNWWLTGPLGLLGGYLASLVGWPLPWMVGSLLAVMLARCIGNLSLQEIPGGRKCGQWMIGIGIGLHFTPAVIEQIAQHSLVVVCGALITTLASGIAIFLLYRGGESRATAFFASMPGGASEMANLGGRNGADIARVSAAHSLRLVLVVLLVPALFQWSLPEVLPLGDKPRIGWLALAALLLAGAGMAMLWQRLRQPNPWLFGPLLVSALASYWLLDQDYSLPPLASGLGQWLIGSALGTHFTRRFFYNAPAFLARTLLGTLLCMLVAALLAELLSWLGALDHRSLLLGMMPGGIAELSLTAEALQLSVPLVTALQTLRLLLVLFLAEPLFRAWLRRSGA